MVAPVFVSYGASVFNTSTTPKTVSVTVQTGDLLVVISVAQSANSPQTTAPTGGSLTYTQRASLGATTNDARAIAWTAPATSDATFSVSASRPSIAGDLWGFNVWVLRSSDGIGAIGAPTVNSTSNSVTLTTTQDNSALCVASSDWNAADGTARTRRTINGSTGSEDTYFRDSTQYTTYAQRYTDCGAAGSVTAGYSAPTGQASAIIAVEVKGTVGGATYVPPTIIVPNFAVRRGGSW